MTENRKYLEGIREEIENYYNGFEEDGEEKGINCSTNISTVFKFLSITQIKTKIY